MAQAQPATGDTPAAPDEGARAGTVMGALSAVLGGVLGLLPHVLHHAGLLVGTAVVTGAEGNLVFGLVGLLLSVPMMLKLRRRFGTWRAPALALAVFAAMFSLSAFVIGPAISSGPDSSEPESPAGTPTDSPSTRPSPSGHEGHHAP